MKGVKLRNDATRVSARPISVGALVARFAITGLVALVVVGAFTAFASRRIGTEQAIEEARRVAYVSSVGLVAPVLSDDLLTLDSDPRVMPSKRWRQSEVNRSPMARVD